MRNPDPPVNCPFLMPRSVRDKMNLILPYGARAIYFKAAAEALIKSIDSNPDPSRIIGALMVGKLNIELTVEPLIHATKSEV